MSSWGRRVYGDPCRECGYDWSISLADAVDVVEDIPRRYADLLSGHDGHERHRDLSWSALAYVCHVGDNLRIWAERLAGRALGATGATGVYDSDRLAEDRAYEQVPLAGALWSLTNAVKDWRAAVDLATETAVVLTHPERGDQTVLDVVRSNAHDAHHHGWDIERSIGSEALPR